ncbi:33348_t:CDS:2, partial [Racocetra persica]
NEFWTNAPNPEKDRDTIKNLHEEGILNISSQTLTTKTFWDCFRDSYNANFKGTDGKMRILSIIAERFTYQEIMNELEVSPNTINTAQKFSRINRPGCVVLEKPKIICSKMSEVKERKFELFFNNKDNVIMSSYKFDERAQLPDHLVHKIELLRLHLKRYYENELDVNEN